VHREFCTPRCKTARRKRSEPRWSLGCYSDRAHVPPALVSGGAGFSLCVCVRLPSCRRWGTATFGGLLVDAGADVQAPIVPWQSGRRLLFIGDSITVGFGNVAPQASSELGRLASPPPARRRAADQAGEGAAECTANSDHSRSWAVQLAHMLRAESHTIAWSGIGLEASAEADTPQDRFMPQMVHQVLANFPDAGVARAAAWRPSAILVHLFTNDYCCSTAACCGTAKCCGTEANTSSIVSTWVDMVLSVTESEHAATAAPPIFAGCGPMGSTGSFPTDPWGRATFVPCTTLLRGVVALGASRGLKVHPIDFSGMYSSDWENVGGCRHPSAYADLQMATIARPIVEDVLGWGA